MKRFMKYKVLIVSVLMMASLTGCDKGDGEADYGFAYIYMPQSMVTGGLSSNYAVPAGGGTMTYNFKVNANKDLDVILGVLKSGKFASNEGYSVNVAVDDAKTTAALAGIASSMAMPSTMYTLPSSVTVPDGETGAGFYLTVDADALKQAIYTGKKLVLAVGLTSTNKYELAATNVNTVVVIDVNAIRAFL